jgi:transcriptional activator for dhaKLM operon
MFRPDQCDALKQLSDDHLLTAQVASFDLISKARPIMEDIYKLIEGSDAVVALANSAGVILDMLGDTIMMEFVQQFNVYSGTFVSETQMGTNAFALALTERIPVSVSGAEHYLQCYHKLAEAASPIFDLTGRLLGALGLITYASRFHPHTLGLAVTGARAIEAQRQTDLLLTEQNSYLAQLNAILSAHSDGIIVGTKERVLMHVNPTASKILGIPEHSLVGRGADEFIVYPQFIREAVENKEPLTDVEVNFEVDGRTISCITNIHYVLNQGEIQWVITTLRGEKDVRRLVQQQVGAYARLTLEDIRGESVAIRRVRRQVKMAAPAKAPIILRGEPGTGKSILASAIHNESPRRDDPFLIFACSTFPSEVVVSELLGFEEGISPQKSHVRPGKFELAHGGTLYFQDVDAMPLEAQGVLLNAIDLGIVQRRWDNRPIPIDIRVIASSSADMELLVSKGNFRSDLFYRLSAFEIRLPALRERKEDLPLLVEWILKRLSKQLYHKIKLERNVIDILRGYSWPGNMRELESVLNRAAVNAGFAGIINPGDLPEDVRYPKVLSGDLQSTIRPRAIYEVERETIIRAAELCNGNVTKMARTLGIGRTTRIIFHPRSTARISSV